MGFIKNKLITARVANRFLDFWSVELSEISITDADPKVFVNNMRRLLSNYMDEVYDDYKNEGKVSMLSKITKAEISTNSMYIPEHHISDILKETDFTNKFVENINSVLTSPYKSYEDDLCEYCGNINYVILKMFRDLSWVLLGHKVGQKYEEFVREEAKEEARKEEVRKEELHKSGNDKKRITR